MTPRRSELDQEQYWFRAISDHVHALTGIQLHVTNRNVYLRKVRSLAERIRHGDLREYYLRLRHHPHRDALVRELLAEITTGETYLYREARQLEHFFDHLLPPILERARGTVFLWSAGCSTGEEPYTLAIMALERGIGPDRLQIVGGDVNDAALARARAGIYGEAAFRSAPPGWRQRYFQEVEPGRWRVRDHVRALVEFAALNLVDRRSLELLPRPHAVFCRNVFIYFDRSARLRAVENLYEVLLPGGLLLLGHAENLLHLPHEFRTETAHGELVYRKPEEGHR